MMDIIDFIENFDDTSDIQFDSRFYIDRNDTVILFNYFNNIFAVIEFTKNHLKSKTKTLSFFQILKHSLNPNICIGSI